MTKKDYIIIAKVLNSVYTAELINLPVPQEEHILFGEIVDLLSSAFKQDNERFQWEKFKQAVYK